MTLMPPAWHPTRLRCRNVGTPQRKRHANARDGTPPTFALQKCRDAPTKASRKRKEGGRATGRSGSAAGDGGNDRHGETVVDLGVEAVEVTDVVVVDEHVHELAQVAVLVDQPVTQPGVRSLECRHDVGQRARLDRNLLLAAGQRAHGGGDANGHCHGRDATGANPDWQGRQCVRRRLGIVATWPPPVASARSSPAPTSSRARSRPTRWRRPSATPAGNSTSSVSKCPWPTAATACSTPSVAPTAPRS